MKTPIIFLLAILIPIHCIAQSVEVDGKLKVNNLDTINTEDNLVVTLPDGTLATRLASTLPTSSSGTERNWQTDLLLTSTLCNCGTLRPAIMQSLLDNGYTVQDLLDFGQSILQLYDAEVSVQVLRDGGLTLQQIYDGGISIVNLLDGGATFAELFAAGFSEQQFLNENIPPFDLYNAGITLDSLIGKKYLGGLIFLMDTITGEGMVALDQDLYDADWRCFNILVGSNGTALGTGEQNTQTMIAAPCRPIYVELLVISPYPGWSIPSKDELNEMYMKIGPGAAPPHTNVGNFDTTKRYWTSTEVDELTVWAQNFADGSGFAFPKVQATFKPTGRLVRYF